MPSPLKELSDAELAKAIPLKFVAVLADGEGQSGRWYIRVVSERDNRLQAISVVQIGEDNFDSAILRALRSLRENGLNEEWINGISI